ncbi:hypothetical protein B0H19DRAFT_1071394 [Mycena capillaripes]|nr:hypothetical protein B0H19DRAFT_1071394 [Mycena capillaripes]
MPLSENNSPLDSNPVAPPGASSETLVGPETTTTIMIPSAATVISIGPSTVSIAEVPSTWILSGSHTVSGPFPATITQAFEITLGGGGEIIGTVPTSVSQVGFVAPIFNTNPLPPPGATELLSRIQQHQNTELTFMLYRTFTGASGYRTIVPIPTSSSSTFIVPPIFGGGDSIVLGAGGIIIGALPPGIVEVGGIHPVPIPPPEGGSPEKEPTRTSAHSSMASSSSAASSFSVASSSSAKCPEPTVLTCGAVCAYEDQSLDRSDDDEDGTGPTRRWRDLMWGALQKRSETRRVTEFEKSSGTRQRFDFAVKGEGTDDFADAFDISKTPVLQSKPRNMGWISEHLFEFQIFSRFMVAFLAKNGKVCSDQWFTDFYNPKKTPEAQDIVNRIDSVPNLVYAKDWINNAKNVGNAQTVGKNGLKKFDADSRKTLENLMRGFGAVPKSRLYKDRVTATGKPCIWIDIDKMVNFMNNTYPTVSTTSLVPERPLCFPTKSAGRLMVRPPPPANPQKAVELSNRMIISDATADGTNIKANLHIEDPNAPGWNYTPVEGATTVCRGVYVCFVHFGFPLSAEVILQRMEAKAPSTGNPLWDLDCTSGKLTVAGKVLPACASPPRSSAPDARLQMGLYCGTSWNQLIACMVDQNTYTGSVEMELVWESIAA